VLCIAKLRAGGHGYYYEVVRNGVEAPGRWLTSGAGQLGLSGTAAEADLEAVLAGADPSSRTTLGRSHDRVTVAGFDLTFCAPKSVSILHALAERDVATQVRDCHTTAVRNSVAYLERRALAVRRRSEGGRAVHEVQAVAGASFLHRASRALDPHLHCHVVIANLGRAPDGTWSALDGRGIYAHRAAVDALYHAHLRHELTERLGVEWGPLDRGRADIAGITPEVRQAFSRRAQMIAAHLAERGLEGTRAAPGVGSGQARQTARAGHRALRIASLATRAPRDSSLAPDTLVVEWRQRAMHAGLTPRSLDSTLGRVPVRAVRETDRVGHEPLRPEIAAALVAKGSGLSRRHMIASWCSTLARGAPTELVERDVDAFVDTLVQRGLLTASHSAARDGPGVAERRHRVEARFVERCTSESGEIESRSIPDERSERARIDRILSARGIARLGDHALARGPDLGLEIGT
jgi:conjugative relaxase-like TrwC/TraI family protein